ncbi:hypothetical protein GCM10009640_25730 [Agrococcus citreus]|uniref:Uncharacterized protein n=1 Tax=Agrococcus citreus TaxID=84643 RepID=A0ABN1YZB6_9MICO
MARQVERRDAEARRDEQRDDVAVGAAEVAHAGQEHDERAVDRAGEVVRERDTVELEDRGGHALRLIKLANDHKG